MRRLLGFIRDEDGPAAVEYVVMLALIIGVMIVSLTAAGRETSLLWSGTTNELNATW